MASTHPNHGTYQGIELDTILPADSDMDLESSKGWGQAEGEEMDPHVRLNTNAPTRLVGDTRKSQGKDFILGLTICGFAWAIMIMPPLFLFKQFGDFPTYLLSAIVGPLLVGGSCAFACTTAYPRTKLVSLLVLIATLTGIIASAGLGYSYPRLKALQNNQKVLFDAKDAHQSPNLDGRSALRFTTKVATDVTRYSFSHYHGDGGDMLCLVVAPVMEKDAKSPTKAGQRQVFEGCACDGECVKNGTPAPCLERCVARFSRSEAYGPSEDATGKFIKQGLVVSGGALPLQLFSGIPDNFSSAVEAWKKDWGGQYSLGPTVLVIVPWDVTAWEQTLEMLVAVTPGVAGGVYVIFLVIVRCVFYPKFVQEGR